MLGCVTAEQLTNESVQSLELGLVAQGVRDLARLIPKLVQAAVTADHQYAIQRRFDRFLRKYASGPTSPPSQVFQITAWIAGNEKCAIWRVIGGDVAAWARPWKDVDRETRQFQRAARLSTSDRKRTLMRLAVEG